MGSVMCYINMSDSKLRLNVTVMPETRDWLARTGNISHAIDTLVQFAKLHNWSLSDFNNEINRALEEMGGAKQLSFYCCAVCDGTGQTLGEICPRCNGTGEYGRFSVTVSDKDVVDPQDGSPRNVLGTVPDTRGYLMSSDTEKQKYAVHVLSEAFKRSLIEHMGLLANKPPIELVAWSKALIEVEQAVRQQLLINVANDSNAI